MDLKYNPIKVIRGHASSINVVKFSPNGRYLASGGQEGIVKIWHVADVTAAGFNHSLAEYIVKGEVDQAVHDLMWLQIEHLQVSAVCLIIATQGSLVVLTLNDVRV